MESGTNQYSPTDQSSLPLNSIEKGQTRDIVAKVINWGIFSGSRKALVTYVELKGNSHGGDRKSKEKVFTMISSDEPSTQKGLAEMIPELEDLVETNIRQRGDVGGSAKKVGLRIKELERIYGIKQGGSGFYGNRHTENNIETPNNSETLKTQEQLAKEMGFSVDTLNNYKKLTEMIPELE